MNEQNLSEEQSENQHMEEENMYVVEKILKKRTIIKDGKKEFMYFVRWEGYPRIEDHTWEPLQNLLSVYDLLEQFEKKLEEKKKRQELGDSHERKSEDKKETNKFQSKNNSSQFRKQQNQQQQVEQKPLKHLKKHQEEIAKPSDLNNTIESEKTYKVETSKLPKKQRSKQAAKNQKANTLIREEQKTQKNQPKKAVLSNQKQQVKPINKQQSNFGRIINHIYKDGELNYEIQVLNSQKKVLKIEKVNTQTVSQMCMKNAYEYLQQFLIRLEESNKQK